MAKIDKRITTSWLSPTKNFRLSSRRLLGFFGGNVQNPSESLMRCVIPPDGYKFIQADQDGAEARVVAYECRRAKLRKLFELGIKAHSYTALQIYTDKFRGEHPPERYLRVEPETLITYPEYPTLFATIKKSGQPYEVGKILRHSINYKAGPRTTQLAALVRSEGMVNLPYSQWKSFIETDHEVFSEIVEWQNEVKNILLSTRTLRNLFGFPREFTAVWSESLVRDGCAFIPQSTVGTVTNMAYVEIHHKVEQERLPWLPLNNKHDSLLLAVPDSREHEEMGIASLRHHLGRTLRSSRGEEYIMGVAISTGYNWGKYHEKNNPNGMKEI